MSGPIRLRRSILVLTLVAVIGLIMWQVGIILQSADEEVRVTDASGQETSISIRAADASLDTPNPAAIAVDLKEGRLAPNFELSTLSGERVRLSDFRGKAVYLNFWATWCGPCRAEMPDIQRTLRKYEASGFVVLAVNNGESFRRAEDFIEELQLNLSIVGLDPTQQVVSRYRVSAMPTSVFIDRQGLIMRIHLGSATEKQMDQFARDALGTAAAVQ